MNLLIFLFEGVPSWHVCHTAPGANTWTLSVWLYRCFFVFCYIQSDEHLPTQTVRHWLDGRWMNRLRLSWKEFIVHFHISNIFKLWLISINPEICVWIIQTHKWWYMVYAEYISLITINAVDLFSLMLCWTLWPRLTDDHSDRLLLFSSLVCLPSLLSMYSTEHLGICEVCALQVMNDISLGKEKHIAPHIFKASVFVHTSSCRRTFSIIL